MRLEMQKKLRKMLAFEQSIYDVKVSAFYPLCAASISRKEAEV